MALEQNAKKDRQGAVEWKKFRLVNLWKRVEGQAKDKPARPMIYLLGRRRRVWLPCFGKACQWAAINYNTIYNPFSDLGDRKYSLVWMTTHVVHYFSGLQRAWTLNIDFGGCEASVPVWTNFDCPMFIVERSCSLENGVKGRKVSRLRCITSYSFRDQQWILDPERWKTFSQTGTHTNTQHTGMPIICAFVCVSVGKEKRKQKKIKKDLPP